MLDNDERARRFEALVQASPDFIAIASVDGKVEFVNQAGRDLVGIDDDTDVCSTQLTDYLTPEGLAASIERGQPAAIGDGHWSGVSTLRDWRGGEPIPVAVSSFVVPGATPDDAVAMATIQRDLRQSLSAEAAVEQARVELAASELRHRALLLHMSDMLMVVTAEGALRYASRSASRILGYDEGSYVGRNVLDLVHPADRLATAAAITDILERPQEERDLGLRILAADGSYRYYEALANNLLDDPAVAGILIAVRDVTERRKTEDAQRAEAEVLELIASEAPVADVLAALALSVEEQLDATLCTVLLAEDAHDGLVFRHGAAPGMPAGYRSALDGREIPGDPSPCGLAVRSGAPVLVHDLLADERFVPMRDLAQVCGVRSCWSFPVTSPTTGALLGTFALYGRTPGLPDDRTAAIVARASRLVAITLDRQALLGRLAYQAQHDDLTGLPNRPSLLALLSDALRRNTPDGKARPAVVFLDLDRLKVVNDSLGHELGDELLVRVAERIPAAVPDGSLVARFGGDEFVVVVDSLGGPPDAAALAERVLAAVRQPVELAGRVITPAASAGVVIARPGQSATEVLRDADVAMYRAKHDGGTGYAVFSNDMRLRAFDRLELEAQMRQGIADGEFRVFYQPVVDLTAGDALVGFEALVRWQHPERGLLSPASFIDLAEETGLIVALGEWVLGTVADTMRSWGREVPRLSGTVAVNLAARQLSAPDLVPAVRRTMREMAPWSLALELTESTLMGDTSTTRGAIDGLVRLGAPLAIDDFGTGFSSLSYLTRLPVQTLKIDKSFVQDLHTPGTRAVAAAVVNLARGLDLSVIAEGIETPEQRAALLDIGCRLGQGYLLGHPLPEDEALAFLRRAAARPARPA